MLGLYEALYKAFQISIFLKNLKNAVGTACLVRVMHVHACSVASNSL